MPIVKEHRYWIAFLYILYCKIFSLDLTRRFFEHRKRRRMCINCINCAKHHTEYSDDSFKLSIVHQQQVGNGISRRHIYNSKIAEGHESVKKLRVSNSQKSTKLTKNPNDRTGDPFGFLTSIVAKHQKIEGGTLWGIFFRKFFFKKNRKGGPFWIFQHPFCRQASKNLKGAL